MEIPPGEVLRYLGYRNQTLDPAMTGLIEECRAETETLIRPGVVYRIYALEKEGDAIRLPATALSLQSRDLSKHLRAADRCVLLAATLGLAIDQKIAAYARLDLTRAIVMDACATAAIEAVCDEVQEQLQAKVTPEGYGLTARFSPGYGDLSIVHQKTILETLQAYARIGLTVTEDHILLPRKSVTAFIGLEKLEEKEMGPPVNEGGAKTAVNPDRCRCCPDQTCQYRKGGNGNATQA
ncbi:MAG: methionine synthase [Firmicutes bacterium]|nr:methionine synthase [Bacillota bacterium]